MLAAFLTLVGEKDEEQNDFRKVKKDLKKSLLWNEGRIYEDFCIYRVSIHSCLPFALESVVSFKSRVDYLRINDKFQLNQSKELKCVACSNSRVVFKANNFLYKLNEIISNCNPDQAALLGTKNRVVFVVRVVSGYKQTGNLNSDETIPMFQRLKFMIALFISTLSSCVVFVILSQTCEAYVNIQIITTSLYYWSDTILLEEPLFEYGSFLFHIYWICRDGRVENLVYLVRMLDGQTRALEMD